VVATLSGDSLGRPHLTYLTKQTLLKPKTVQKYAFFCFLFAAYYPYATKKITIGDEVNHFAYFNWFPAG
jgi:hypothetical protein